MTIYSTLWVELGRLLGDYLGRVSFVIDNDRRVLSRQDSTPWGEARCGDITQTTLDFTGLLYYGARYYDPVLGRFLSADSIVPGRGRDSNILGVARAKCATSPNCRPS